MYESATHCRLQPLPEAACSVKIPSAQFSKPAGKETMLLICPL
jgi:hypothetical protein